ncbi:hypothetical protein [Streptomyces sp. NPDC056061]|uniref:hypothetical protein n=1 Tax=Streptomyces sp. NPDC056061 TaxID=3345700 RepID=UPI0035DE48FF
MAVTSGGNCCAVATRRSASEAPGIAASTSAATALRPAVDLPVRAPGAVRPESSSTRSSHRTSPHC